MSRWIKRGLIFDPEGQADWFVSHAALPIPQQIEDSRYRVYFSGRDEQGRAQIGYFVFDLNTPQTVIEVSSDCVLGVGKPGTFDDRGLTAGCLVEYQEIQYLYYAGWNLGVTVPFYFYTGLATAPKNSLDFKRVFDAPVMPRSAADPYLTASPSIVIEDGVWRMWYVSCTGWEMINDQPKHYYHIKYAESDDGIQWRRDGHVCIDYASPEEYAFGRPCVLRHNGVYKMWYCFRGDAYRLGNAESEDGLQWTRKDAEAGMDVSAEGWDSEMIAYPYVFEYGGRLHMLYNGNGYGRSGIGYATLDE